MWATVKTDRSKLGNMVMSKTQDAESSPFCPHNSSLGKKSEAAQLPKQSVQIFSNPSMTGKMEVVKDHRPPFALQVATPIPRDRNGLFQNNLTLETEELDSCEF